MIADIIKALIFAGIPVALFSYYLVSLTRKNTSLTSNNATELKKELKQLSLEENKDDNLLIRLLQKKFMKFGGGFYGIITLMTYLHIEFNQTIDFLKNFTGFQDFIDKIGLKMMINFIIEAVMNLVSAFLWPIYWVKYLPIDSLSIWLVVAFLAHWFATKYALTKD